MSTSVMMTTRERAAFLIGISVASINSATIYRIEGWPIGLRVGVGLLVMSAGLFFLEKVKL